MNDRLLDYAIRIQSIAQAGLQYGKDKYDRERYAELREIAAEMISAKTEISMEKVRDLFCNETGYQTPKIDTRAAVFIDGKILLVHENNGTWCLPGGWCDVDQSIASNTEKEVREEAGFTVTRVYPGLKENGAVFSHPNPWAWCAEAILGRGSRAMKFYNALCPALQNDIIEVRQSEPYSYCQFVVGKDHTAYGRARHPFMTGSSGWAYFAATQYMLGIRPDFDGITVDPCIPADWKEFSVSRKWRGAEYHIHVTNPDAVEKGVKSITMNGRQVRKLPVLPVGTVCDVEVVMG